MADTDVDALPGDDELAAAADPSLHLERLSGWLGFRSGRASVADPGEVGFGERVGQGAEQCVPVGEVQQVAVDADGQALSGELVTDRVLLAGERE